MVDLVLVFAYAEYRKFIPESEGERASFVGRVVNGAVIRVSCCF